MEQLLAAVQPHLDTWTNQRDGLRDFLREFWVNRERSFGPFWRDAGQFPSYMREAMVRASLEQLRDEVSNLGELPMITCPELQRIAQAPEGSESSAITWQLMESLAADQENAGDAPGSTPTSRSPIDRSFDLIRSCTLLRFCTGVISIYESEEADAAIDRGKAD
jgi:hypothetical protein